MNTVTRRQLPLAMIAAKLALVMSVAGSGLFALPAHAAQRGAYSASLATPLAQPRQEIVGGVLWKCAAERCSAPAGGSRPVLVCERVAKTFGPVARFTTPAGELSSDDLTRCNGTN